MRQDVSELVASLKPGDAEADFPAALRESKKRRYQWDSLWSISLDKSGRIESINYWASFPSHIDIGDLRIGMTQEQLTKRVPDSRVIDADPETGDAVVELLDVGPSIRRARISKGKLVVLEIADKAAKDTRLLQWIDEGVRKRRARSRPVTTNPDVLLDFWAEDALYLTFDGSVLPRFVKWLRAASPDQWHGVARGWNWDNGIVPLNWIIHQPECDLATAVLLHHLADASYYHKFAGDRSRVPPVNLAGFDFIIGIRARIANGLYPRHEISIKQGLEDIGNGDGLVVAPRPGRDVPKLKSDEGIPIEVYATS